VTEYGELIAPETVRFERTLPGPINLVWSYIVDAEKRSRWLCGGRTELRDGGLVEMHFHNAGLSSQEDIAPPEKYKDMPEHVRFSGTVTACVPPKFLSHTWDFEGDSSEVTYELAECGENVVLTLTHRRLNSREEAVSVCGGWHTHLDILKDVLTGEEPKPFWTRHTLIEDQYERRI